MKKKKKSPKCRLSKTDKNIYKILTVLPPIFSTILTVTTFKRLQKSVFENTHILAQKSPLLLVFLFSGIASGLIIAGIFHRLKGKKQPIFKKFEGSPNAPIFSRHFWKVLFSERKKSMTVGLCAFLLVIVLPLITFFSLNSKERLYDDGSISVYNILNENTEQYVTADVEEFRIDTRLYRERSRKHTKYSWRFEIKISMQDGKSFLFLYGDFPSMEAVYQAKNCFSPDVVTVEGEENIESVIQDMNLDEHESELLYRIFEIPLS